MLEVSDEFHSFEYAGYSEPQLATCGFPRAAQGKLFVSKWLKEKIL